MLHLKAVNELGIKKYKLFLAMYKHHKRRNEPMLNASPLQPSLKHYS